MGGGIFLHQISQIFGMKLGDQNGRKLHEADFSRKLLFLLFWHFQGPNCPKSRFLPLCKNLSGWIGPISHIQIDLINIYNFSIDLKCCKTHLDPFLGHFRPKNQLKSGFSHFSQIGVLGSVRYCIFRQILSISTTFALTPRPSGAPNFFYKQFLVKFRSNQANLHKMTYFWKG